MTKLVGFELDWNWLTESPPSNDQVILWLGWPVLSESESNPSSWSSLTTWHCCIDHKMQSWLTFGSIQKKLTTFKTSFHRKCFLHFFWQHGSFKTFLIRSGFLACLAYTDKSFSVCPSFMATNWLSIRPEAGRSGSPSSSLLEDTELDTDSDLTRLLLFEGAESEEVSGTSKRWSMARKRLFIVKWYWYFLLSDLDLDLDSNAEEEDMRGCHTVFQSQFFVIQLVVFQSR